MKRFFTQLDRPIVALAAVFFLSIGAMIWHVSSLQSSLLKASAINTARLFSLTLTEVRTLYTSDVVQRAKNYGIEVTHDYLLKKNAIPLPATFSMRLGELMGKSSGDAYSRLYSPYPFPWRSVEGGLSDDFAKQAWEVLSRNQSEPYLQFIESERGLELRYATADVMRPACVNCHNSHLQSPKRNWKEGDLRGVLEIILPLENISRQVADQVMKIRLIYSLVGLFMLAGFVLAIHRLKQSEKNLTLSSIELQVANQQLKDISESDALTGIPNRRCYNARLRSGVLATKRSNDSLSILLIDIDYFKLYNDGYGHQQGDETLIQIASIASSCVSRETDLLARYGGEEFVALLPFTDVEGAIGIADNIRAEVEAAAIPHEYASQGDCITVSIGIATQTGIDIDGDGLFKIADTALYRAKANGRNRCEVYRPD